MFTFTVKADKRKMFIVLAVLLLAVTLVIVLTKVHNAAPSAECAGVKYTLSAATNAERVSFFSQFGWKVDAEPVETKAKAPAPDPVQEGVNQLRKLLPF